jgi:hypothetical protein
MRLSFHTLWVYTPTINGSFMVFPAYRIYGNNLSADFTNARYFFYPKPHFADMLDHLAA